MPNLETVRGKVIEANPEIKNRITPVVGKRGGITYQTHTPVIRLADVLVAIGDDYAVIGNGVFLRYKSFNRLGQDGDWILADRNARWNLREDDLSKQSPETLAFLAKLLGCEEINK